MQGLNEFNDEAIKNDELGLEDPKMDGVGSWDEDQNDRQEEESEDPGPYQDEESVLNADVVLAEPGLKQEIVNSDIPGENGDHEEEEDEKNTPQENSRRVLSFNDYFTSSR
jgi:hypothetical protein